jgi:hypothetical protein
MAYSQRPNFHFHYSRNWLKSHPRLTDSLKTFGLALGAVALAAIAAALVVRLEWTLNASHEVVAAADITAAVSGRPHSGVDLPRK